MSNRATFTGLIAQRIGPDRQGLNPDDFVDPAVRLYERYRPRLIVKEITGNGTRSYASTAIDSTLWVPGFTRVLGIEWPVDEVPPTWYDDDGNDWLVVDAENTGASLETRVQSLILRMAEPAASETFRVKFTARHTASGGSAGISTIDAADEHAVADFATSMFLEALAVHYGGLATQEGLDVVAYEEKARSALTNARAAKRRARMALGLSADERDDEAIQGNALAIRNYELADKLHGGRGGLTHGRTGWPG